MLTSYSSLFMISLNVILNYSSSYASLTNSNYNYFTDANPLSYFFQTSILANNVFLIIGMSTSDWTSKWTKSFEVKFTKEEFYSNI